MRLYTIAEDIRHSEFYDFYSLVIALGEYRTNMGNPEHKREILQNLKYVGRHIFDDHMDQLIRIMVERWVDSNPIPLGATSDVNHYYGKIKREPNGVERVTHEQNPANTRPGNIHILQKYGIGVKKLSRGGYVFYDPIKQDILKLSRQQQANMLQEMIDAPKNNAYHTLAGETWRSLAKAFVSLARTNTNNVRSLVFAIDRIYGLLHHGGSITDYFDEKSWIKQALDTREVAKPNEIFSQASQYIRELVTSASTGIPTQPGSNYQKSPDEERERQERQRR